jgi:hypothetical protein
MRPNPLARRGPLLGVVLACRTSNLQSYQGPLSSAICVLNLMLPIVLVSMLTTTASSNPVLDVSQAQTPVAERHAFNVIVDDRLHTATPFSLPCFSIYNNISVSVNGVACNSIQSNHTLPNFRLKSFSANMNVSDSEKFRLPHFRQVDYETLESLRRATSLTGGCSLRCAGQSFSSS